jgi:hypothetical protein
VYIYICLFIYIYTYVCVYVYLCIFGKHPFINRPTVLRDTYFDLLYSYSNYMFFVFFSMCLSRPNLCINDMYLYVCKHIIQLIYTCIRSSIQVLAQGCSFNLGAGDRLLQVGGKARGEKPVASWFRISHRSPTRKKKHDNTMVSRSANIKMEL